MAERATTATAGVQRAPWSVPAPGPARGMPAADISLPGRYLGISLLRCLPAGAGEFPVVRRIASDRVGGGPGKATGSGRLRRSSGSEGRVVWAGRMVGGSSGQLAARDALQRIS